MNVYVVCVSEHDCVPYVHLRSVEGYCLEFAGKTDGCCMPVSLKSARGHKLGYCKLKNSHSSHRRMFCFLYQVACDNRSSFRYQKGTIEKYSVLY